MPQILTTAEIDAMMECVEQMETGQHVPCEDCSLCGCCCASDGEEE